MGKGARTKMKKRRKTSEAQEPDVEVKMALLDDPLFIPDVHKLMMSEEVWSCDGLQAVVRLAWALALRSVSNFSTVSTGMMNDVIAIGVSLSRMFVGVGTNSDDVIAIGVLLL